MVYLAFDSTIGVSYAALPDHRPENDFSLPIMLFSSEVPYRFFRWVGGPEITGRSNWRMKKKCTP